MAKYAIIILFIILSINTVVAVSSSISVEIIETKNLKIDFVRVDEITNDDFDTINDYKGVVMNYEK